MAFARTVDEWKVRASRPDNDYSGFSEASRIKIDRAGMDVDPESLNVDPESLDVDPESLNEYPGAIVVDCAAIAFYCLTSDKAGRLASQPLKSNIVVAIAEVLSKAKADDTVIIVLVGHGLEIEGEARFCPADMRGGSRDMYLATTVSINGIIKDFGACKAKHKVMFIEACRDEVALPEGVLPVKPLASVPEGVLLVQSGSSGQSSVGVKSDVFSHGVFSFALLEGLCGAAMKNGAGNITQTSLCAYVMDRAAELAEELAGHKQTPTMLGNTDQFIMVPKDKINQQKKLEELLAECQKEAKMGFCDKIHG